MRNHVCFIFLALAILTGAAHLAIQCAGGDLRGGPAARTLKPMPAAFVACACLICCASFRFRADPKLAQSSAAPGVFRVAKSAGNRCQFDLWCSFFVLAFACFALGDALLGNEANDPTTGVAVFCAGQLVLAVGMCLPRENGQRMPPFVAKHAAFYAGAAVATAVPAAIVTGSKLCGASAGAAALAALYVFVMFGAAWRSTDVRFPPKREVAPTGSTLIFVGAHLFIASDLFVWLHSLCGVFESEGALVAYYLLSGVPYYAAVWLEGRGVTKYALETRSYEEQRDNENFTDEMVSACER